jgi:hypothetical protein
MDSINKVKKESQEKAKTKKEGWYDKISIRGYAQIRYNGLLSSNDKVSCDQCDKSGERLQPPKTQSLIMIFSKKAHYIFWTGSS